MNALTNRFNFAHLTASTCQSALYMGLLTVTLGFLTPQATASAYSGSAASSSSRSEAQAQAVQENAKSIAQTVTESETEFSAPIPGWLIPVGVMGVLTLGCLLELYRHRCYLDLETVESTSTSSQTNPVNRPSCDVYYSGEYYSGESVEECS